MGKIINRNQFLFYFTLLVISLFLSCLSMNYDYDLFARLIVGERFIEQGIFPYQDFLSYTPTHPWYDHEWGSGVVFYLLLKYFGTFGFILFQTVIMFFTSVFVMKTQKLQRHAFPVSSTFMTLFLVLFFLVNTELVRCQLFSFLFFSIFLYILEGTIKGKFKNLIWIFPFITIFWNNVHGGIVSGLGLIAMYALGAILERKPFRKYIEVLFVSVFSLIINPYGIKYLNFLFSAATMNRKYVVEWWPFYKGNNLSHFGFQCVYIAFCYVLTILTSVFKTKKYDYTKLIVLSVTLLLGLMHVKLVSLALIASTALCYNEIAKIFLKLKKIIAKFEKCLILSTIGLAVFIFFSSPSASRVNFNKLPILETEFLLVNNFKGNIVIPFGFGSYVSYKVYPNIKIYMDGRYEEVYNNQEFDTLRDFELIYDNWRDVFEKYPTNMIMAIIDSDIYNKMKEESGWIHVFDGTKCGVFIKEELKKDKYIEPSYDKNYYRKTMFEHKPFINDKEENI